MCLSRNLLGSAADTVNAHVFSPDSSFQLAALRFSLLPLPGCSFRGHRHVGICFCLGVSRPSPPLQPARSWRHNPLCCLQYGCSKGNLHIINTAAAWGNHPEVVSNYCRYFLAQMRVIRQTAPVKRRRSLCHPHRSVLSESTKQFHMCYDGVVVRDK